MANAAPIDPLAALKISTGAPVAAGIEGEPPASQRAHRLRNVENQVTPATATSASTTDAAPSTSAATTDDVPPVTEEAFAPTAPSVISAAAGGPLIAAETTSVMVSSKLENGEPVLTLRVAPIVAASAPTVDSADPDNAVEPTTISAPPSEQALATPALAVAPAPAPAVQPAAPPAELHHALSVRPRAKPALSEPAPASVEPAPLPRRAHTRVAPARVTTTAAPAKPAPADDAAPAPSPTPDPLNAPYMPTQEEPVAPIPAPAEPAATSTDAQPTGGPTPLVMPQN